MKPPLVLGSCIIVALSACASQTLDKGDVSVSPTDSGEMMADCDEVLGGVPWGEPSVSDGNPDLESILAAIDFSTYPAQLEIGELAAIYRGGIAYALDIPPAELGDTLDRDAVLASGPLGWVVLASLDPDLATDFDYMRFRQGLFRYYTCSRAFPMTLNGFEAVFGAIAVDYTDIASAAKCGTRRLRIDPEAGVYVAESLIEGEVRETEILIENNRRDGQLDFVVYGADGVLTDRSQFPTLGGGPHLVVSAPYVCMTCHLNSSADDDTWGYDTLYPTGTGPCAE